MKRLLYLSLGLHLALLLVLVFLHYNRRSQVGAGLVSPIAQLDSSMSATVIKPGLKTTTGREDAKGALTTWAWIDSKDPAVLIERLREVGCPEKTIQDITCLRLARAARDRAMAMVAAYDAETPYWRNGGEKSRKLDQQLRGVRLAMLAQLDEIWGTDANSIRARLLGLPDDPSGKDFLSAEKSIALVKLIRAGLVAENEATFSTPEGPPGWMSKRDEVDRLKRARKQDEAIRALLSPQEYEEYVVRSSPTAQLILSQLPSASTADEFRRMVLLAHEAGLGDAPPGFLIIASTDPYAGEDPMKEWRNRAAEFRSKLAEELGSDRLSVLEAQDKARAKAELESDVREELEVMANHAGLSRQESESLFDSLRGIGETIDARFESLFRQTTQRGELEILKTQKEAEMEKAIIEYFGAQKGQKLLDALRQGSH